MNHRHTFIALFTAFFCSLFGLTSCIEDGFTSSPSDRPVFSTDTLNLGTIITEDVSTTHRFTVRNPHSKGLIISDIRLSGKNAGYFRLNVDGFSGTDFSNVEIRANDSIYVLVSCTLPVNNVDIPVDLTANIDFTTNGVVSSVVVAATGQDVNRLRACTVAENTVFDDRRPYQIFDSLVVAPGATLTLPAGTTLMFHDKARMVVHGTLITEGTVDRPVELRGDRTGNVITDITFDLMSRQWDGLAFTSTSRDNILNHTVVRNTVYPTTVDHADLTIINSRLRNSGTLVLDVCGGSVNAVGSEFAEAAEGVIYLDGGTHSFNHCTFTNYYLFSAIGGPAVGLNHLDSDSDNESGEPFTVAEFTNSIIYGLGSDISHGNLDGTSVYLRNCLLKSKGSDDDNFVNCIWDEDPLYYTVRNDYIFDYALKPESPAIGAADASLNTNPAVEVDMRGNRRNTPPDLGAYTFVEPAE